MADLPVNSASKRELAERVLTKQLKARSNNSGQLAPAEDETRLSFAQERMWFLSALDAQTSAYNITSAVSVSGEVDIVRLAYAVERLIKRHPSLRVAITTAADGTPRADYAQSVGDRLQVIDAPTADQAQGYLEAQLLTPFDLNQTGLFRVVLVKSAPNASLLGIALHHIIADGWSLGIMHRELAAIYADPDIELEHPASFASHVQAERAWATGADGRAGLEYWTKQLDGVVPLDLPFMKQRPAVARFTGRRIEAHVDEGLTARLERIARENHCSLYMLLASAFATTLHGYSGQADVVFGSPVANRDDPRFENTVGLFVNSVVLRTDLTGEPTFELLLARMRSVVLEAIEYQQTPFEAIVEAMRPERTLSHNPLFQVMFALQNADSGYLDLPGTRVTSISSDTDVCRFDIECTLWRKADGMRVRLNYRDDLFDSATAERMVNNLKQTLAAIADHPNAPVAELVAQSIHADVFERAAAPTPTAMSETLWGLFDVAARAFPSATAIADAERSLTFAELRHRALVVAERLAELGISRGDIVAVRTVRSVDLVAATLGVLASGAAFLPMSPDDPADRQRFVLEDSGAKAVVTDDLETESYVPLVAVAPAGVLGLVEPVLARPEDLAYVIYTSGTTGRPKGVAVENRNIVNTLAACQQLLGFGPSDRGLVLASSTFDVFYYELFSSMLAGGSSRLVNHAELFDPARLVETLDGATSFQAVPGMMEHLLTAMAVSGVDRSETMRVAMTGGDLVPSRLLQRMGEVFPNAQVVITYGPTEAAIFATAYFARPDADGYPIGRPIPGAEIRVVDDNGAVVAPGVTGEVLIGGAGVGRGYVNRPEETTQRFILIDEQRFYRSGDRARWLPDGSLEFLGRSDNQVKIRGFRIELGEVESVLNEAPGVRQAIVIAAGEETSERHLVAYIVPDDRPQSSVEANNGDGIVESWQELFDQTHDQGDVTHERDFTGWNSSYTGEPFPYNEMDEWVDSTIGLIRDKCGDNARKRILEIGCGTGLLLMELAEGCDRYVGIDFSAQALAGLRNKVRGQGWSHVELRQARADELTLGEEFDLVVINSVAQYFPDQQYLDGVVAQTRRCLAPDGQLFVGDVRNLALLEAFHHSVVASHHPSASIAELRALTDRATGNDTELIIDPTYFSAPDVRGAEIGHVQVSPRRGFAHNELTKFRYDVVMSRSAPQPPIPVDWQSWSDGQWSEERIASALQSRNLETIALLDIPNQRVAADVAACVHLRGLGSNNSGSIENAVHPERLHDLARVHGYRVSVSWGRGNGDGSYDACFVRNDRVGTPADPRIVVAEALTNDPAVQVSKRRLVSVAREVISARLPSYMLPSAIVPIDKIPLTPNGKVDRSRLPSMSTTDEPRRALKTATEKAVGKAWQTVLGAENISANDDFFEIGGTSLLAIRVTVALRQQGLNLAPQKIFERRTVERLASWLDSSATVPVDPSVQSPSANREEKVSPLDFLLRSDLERGRWASTNRVFLTGATGMLGVHVLDELLRAYPHISIDCLVRGAGQVEAQQRLVERYRWQHLDSPLTDEAFARRVKAVNGDFRKERFGLDDEAWTALADRIDAVVHVGADVRHVAVEADLFVANTFGTRQVLALCAAMSEPRLVHVSTIGVAGRTSSSAAVTFDENDLDLGQTMTEAYSASKMAAERLVRQAPFFGSGVSVLRVGTVAPHSRSGRFQHNIDAHFFSRYLRGVLGLGVAGDFSTRTFTPIPADEMAKVILLLTDLQYSNGQTFHVQTPHLLTHAGLAVALQRLGYEIDLLSVDEFSARVVELSSDARHVEDAGRLLPWLEPPTGNAVQLRFDKTQALLSALGYEYPEPDDEWIGRFVAHGVAEGYFPPVDAL